MLPKNATSITRIIERRRLEAILSKECETVLQGEAHLSERKNAVTKAMKAKINSSFTIISVLRISSGNFFLLSAPVEFEQQSSIEL
jgi:formylmethanofuran:tetrahydromethanopterin formyltransferase